MNASTEQLNVRFPKPASPPAPIVSNPVRHAGWTNESTRAVLECLKDNHKRFHIFFNEKGFHNHSSHHLLAIYAMGASSGVVRAAYGTHTVYQRPAFPPPENAEAKDTQVITESNWKDFLGDERYYQAYVAFFSGLLLSVKENALRGVMDDYIFSVDANLVPGKAGVKPFMLSRLLAGFLHPLIHLGYGAEFSLPGLAAEGLAQAAVHRVEAEVVFTPKFFGISDSEATAAGLVSKLGSLSLFGTTSTASVDVHALSILAKVSKDPTFAPQNMGLPLPPDQGRRSIDVAVGHDNGKLLKYAEEWANSVRADPSVLARKLEEVIWMNSVVYGVAGWGGRAQGGDNRGHFNADFFYMHGVTSALMMVPLVNTASPDGAALLLRTYFLFSLALYVVRGRPALPISDFYDTTSLYPTPPGAQSAAAQGTLAPSGTPNPWLPVVQTTLVHPNEHLCKAQRALLHFAQCFGGAEPGAFAGCGLDGADRLDGTLFARVAGLTADRLGWMREGEAQREWDFAGFFEQI